MRSEKLLEELRDEWLTELPSSLDEVDASLELVKIHVLLEIRDALEELVAEERS